MSEFKKEKYSNKIILLKKLKKIVGNFPRKRKTILCHGNFDVVHPGHVRHLTYAKSKADILIVSITADKFIKKGKYRPFVPENLRALNLAAFQMVDYVFIDYNEKPLKTLNYLKPDLFAKGFEYNSAGLSPASKEESETVSKYGGEMIFTPGDIVFSSTKILNISKPKIDNYKLIDLMERNNITFKILKNTLKKINNIKIHVVGDTIIDTYTKTSLIGGHTKTPTPSVLFQNKTHYVGGAGIVAKHLKSAGADVCFTTLLGNDELRSLTVEEMKKDKIKINIVEDKTRPTTNKETIISNGYKLLKVDRVDNQPISEKILNKFKNFISKEKCDAIIFSDFRHGIFNKNSIQAFIKSIPKNTFKVADSQVATRWGNITEFKKFDLITPNEKEARFSLADQDSSISDLTTRLRSITKFKNLILKLGEKGAVSVKNNFYFTIPSFARNIVDAVGAGDAMLAYATLSLVSSKSLVISTILGSIAAACECEIEGNISIQKKSIIEKLDLINKSSNFEIYKQ